MKILQVVHNDPFSGQGGTELYTRGLALSLSERHEVYVFCRISDSALKDYQVRKTNHGPVTVYSLNNTLEGCHSFKMLYQNDEIDRKFAEVLDEIRPDLVHIQHLAFLSIGLIGKAKDKGIPVVFTLHDYWLICPKWQLFKPDCNSCLEAYGGNFSEECSVCLGDMLNIKPNDLRLFFIIRKIFSPAVVRFLRRAYSLFSRNKAGKARAAKELSERVFEIKNALNCVNVFLAPSHYLRDCFIKFGIPSKKISYSPFGLKGHFPGIARKTPSKKIRFGFIGTLLPAKGPHVLIEAFNGIKDENAELKIYGDLRVYAGYEDYLPRIKKSLKNRNIQLMGRFEHKDIERIFNEIDVLIVPSLWQENRPLVIEEAFLSLTPVIASRIGGIPELVKDGLNGFLSDPADEKSLRGKIVEMVKNPAVIDIIKNNIAESGDTRREITEDVYEELAYKELLQV